VSEGPKKNGPQALGRSRGGLTTKLHLRADRKVAYERVAEVMSDAQAGGLTKLGFVTEPAAKEK